ncbi:hypothetical protein MRX96_008809 [Rhipicephalus microplus]
MCLLTSFHGPPCVADGDPMFVGHQLLHPSTTTVFVNEILALKTSGVCMMIFAGTPLPTSSLSCLMPFPSVDASLLHRPL